MIISNVYLNGKAVSANELKTVTIKNREVSSILKTATKRGNEGRKGENMGSMQINNKSQF